MGVAFKDSGSSRQPLDLIGLNPRSLLPLASGKEPTQPLGPIGGGVTHLWLAPHIGTNVYVWHTAPREWSVFRPSSYGDLS
jgi:hypothetical protein